MALLLTPGSAAASPGVGSVTGPAPTRLSVSAPWDAAGTSVATRKRKKRRSYVSPGYKPKRKKVRVSPVDPPVRPLIPLADAGLEPRVLLDAAGTAHITWTEPQPVPGRTGQSEVYCRLPRGAQACDVLKKWPEQFKDMPANDPDFSAGNDDGVQPLALGDDLALISSRYPYSTVKIPGRPPLGTPDYQDSWATFLDLSVDGGTTFAPRTWIGDLPVRDAAVVGPPTSPSIVGITDSYPLGGTSVQTYVGGQQSVRTAKLGTDFDDFVGGRVVNDAGLPLAVWRNLDGTGYLGRWTGQGDPNDAATWQKAAIGPAYAAALSSGPAGAFLLSQSGPYTTTPQLRRISGLSLGPAVEAAPGEWATVQQDGAGGVYVGSLEPKTRAVFRVQRGDGNTFAAQVPVARAPQGQPFSDARLGGAAAPRFAVLPDGGGVAVLESDNGSYSRIWAASFGTLAPTGQPGLGGRPGEGVVGPDAVVECGRIAFGAVEMRTQQGCFFGSGASKKLRVAQGPVDLNGVWLRPSKGVQIQIHPGKKTIDTTGPVKVQLDAPGGPITLWNGELHLKLPKPNKGTLLASFDTKKFGAQLKGFPISGKVDVELTDKGVRIPVYLKLPKAFLDAKGEAVLRSDLGSGLRLDTLRITIGEAFLGGPTLRNALLEYTADTDEWYGQAELVMPPGNGSAGFAAAVRFAGGKFKEGKVEVTLAYPGLPLFTGVYLAKVNGAFALAPTKVTVGGTVGVLPDGAKSFVVVNTADATLTFGKPWQMKVVGNSKLLDRIPVQQMEMLLRGDGFLSYTGNGSVSLKFIGTGVGIDSTVDLAFDLPKNVFSGKFTGGKATLYFPSPFPNVSVNASKAVISSRGMGLCSGGAGFRYSYAGDDFAVFLPKKFGGGGCDLGPIQVVVSTKQASAAKRRAAATGGLRLRGGRGAVLYVDGDGAAPTVTLTDPRGNRIDPVRPATVDEAKAARVMALDAGTQTIVSIRKPEKGVWRVEAAPGSAAITGIRFAEIQPAPRLKTRIVRRKGRFTLRYSLRGGTKLGAVIREQTRGGAARVIGQIKQGKGTLRIPAGGPAGRRILRAELTRDGIPVTSVPAGRYTAPSPPRPGKPRGLRLKRTKRGVLVRWRSTPRADAQTLVVRSGDGMQRRITLAPKAKKVRVGGIDRDDRVTAMLHGVTDGGLRGPAARARLKPAKKRR